MPTPPGAAPSGHDPRAVAGQEFSTRLGGLTVYRVHEPAVLWIRARGFVPPGPLRAALSQAHDFGMEYPAGWSWVADLSRAFGFDPRNLMLLRGIHRLPNLRAYVVLAPGSMQRRLLGWGSILVKPDAIVRSAAEAWEVCRRP